MKRSRTLRTCLAVILGTTGAWLMTMSFQQAKPPITTGLQLALKKLTLNRFNTDKNKGPLLDGTPKPNVPPPPNAPTFGHPVISGIGGFGYEENLRLDPTDPTRIYTSVPGSAAANTSWIWRSLDTGKTFKWVPAATPLEGKVTTCAGGGDTELGVDSAGHLYFNDLTLANFSVSRSDDDGVTFTCNNTGVPDAAVDRQWYVIDGDPTNGGTLYLANDEIGPGGVNCGNGVGGTAATTSLSCIARPRPLLLARRLVSRSAPPITSRRSVAAMKESWATTKLAKWRRRLDSQMVLVDLRNFRRR